MITKNVSTDADGTRTEIYIQDPIDDSAWVREDRFTPGNMSYTLILKDEDLVMTINEGAFDE